MSAIDDVDIGIIEVRIPYSFTLADNIAEEVILREVEDKAVGLFEELNKLCSDGLLNLEMSFHEFGITDICRHYVDLPAGNSILVNCEVVIKVYPSDGKQLYFNSEKGILY